MSDYPALTFAPGVDWQHVNPQLWIGLNDVLTQLGKRGLVISGYRSNAHSIAVGGFAGDPHTKAIAADVFVNGEPIGNVPGIIPLLAAHGIESGNQPGFFHGMTDPPHVQLSGAGQSTSNPQSDSQPTQDVSSLGCAGMVVLTLLTFAIPMVGWFYGFY